MNVAFGSRSQTAPSMRTATITVLTGHAVNRFDPYTALGVGFDVMPPDVQSAAGFSARNMKHLREAGWTAVSYRLYTELSSEAWHWNPVGRYSDGTQGYWTSSAAGRSLIVSSPGIVLPRRGMTGPTVDDPSSYSRLDDGSTRSFWKSNPYLDQRFTGEPDAQHPQWIVLDLGRPVRVQGVRIAWRQPYATAYQVQGWTGNDAIGSPESGTWRTLPGGFVRHGHGGTVTLRLSRSRMQTRDIRIRMTASSHTCSRPHVGDPRDCVGYAVSEVFAGPLNSRGSVLDVIHHTSNARRQTPVYVSSSDPWEGRGAPRGVEQPGLDLVYHRAVPVGHAMMIPVSLAYGTPENAVNEVRYLRAHGYPLRYIEMGEEPDGQLMTPEDYASLYWQWARALHREDPGLQLGGPVYQGTNGDVLTWRDTMGTTSWTARFIRALRRHGSLHDLAFFSFEHYPFDTCRTDNRQLLEEPQQVDHIMATWRRAGVPRGIPWFITEYNYSATACLPMVSLTGALWQADFMGQFLVDGGAGAYYYQGLPANLDRYSSAWSAFAMMRGDQHGQWSGNYAQYAASQLIARRWSQKTDAHESIFPLAISAPPDPYTGKPVLTAYALHRPDGRWSLLVINKDPLHAVTTRVIFHAPSGRPGAYTGSVTSWSFGPAQYAWHPRGSNGYARPNNPPKHRSIQANGSTRFTFGPYSITVLTGIMTYHTIH